METKNKGLFEAGKEKAENTNAAPAKAEQSAAVARQEKTTTYLVRGKEVTLTHNIVRNFLTKGNGNVTDADIVQFIGICKYNELNPFLGEAYLVKFGESPAEKITSKEAYFKRAEAHPDYEGIQAGIIVLRKDEIIEVEGCFMNPGDKLLGGWAKVYRKDKKFPFVAKLNLEEYDKKQALWNSKKATMISKTAKVQALREAFPSLLGALYTAEESSLDIPAEESSLDIPAEERNAKVAAGVGSRHIDTQEVEYEEVRTEPEPAPVPDTHAEEAPETEAPAPEDAEPPYGN